MHIFSALVWGHRATAPELEPKSPSVLPATLELATASATRSRESAKLPKGFYSPWTAPESCVSSGRGKTYFVSQFGSALISWHTGTSFCTGNRGAKTCYRRCGSPDGYANLADITHILLWEQIYLHLQRNKNKTRISSGFCVSGTCSAYVIWKDI